MTYMSTPLRASLMVLCWTSVMFSIFMLLVMVLTRLGCTRPREPSSENVVAGPSSAIASSAWTSCATCCHFALLWKPATAALARRAAGILRAAGVRVRGVRRACDETVARQRLLDRVAGHLLNAPNMVSGVSAGDSPLCLGFSKGVSCSKVLVYNSEEMRAKEGRLKCQRQMVDGSPVMVPAETFVLDFFSASRVEKARSTPLR